MSAEQRKCNLCHETKPVADFSSKDTRCRQCNRQRRHRDYHKSPEKYREKARSARAKNPERAKALQKARYWKDRDKSLAGLRKWSLKRNYGITLEEYDAMFRAQCGKCAICGGVNADGRNLHVDHNHESGIVRSLLCSKCNTAIGLVNENRDTLRYMIAYLDFHALRDIGGAS